MTWRGVVEENRSRLPLAPGVRAITLLEGNTPLLEAPRLAKVSVFRVLGLTRS